MAILKNDGSLWTCGANTYGALGNGKWYLTNMVGEITDGEGTDVLTPAKIMEDVVDVSCENGASIALKKTAAIGPGDGTSGANWAIRTGTHLYFLRAGRGQGHYIQSFPRQPGVPLYPQKAAKDIYRSGLLGCLSGGLLREARAVGRLTTP